MNKILLERAQCMLSNIVLSKELWTEAVNTAAYLVNRSPSTAIDWKTPEEVWSGKHANYENLRIFGCPAYAQNEELIDAGRDHDVREKAELKLEQLDVKTAFLHSELEEQIFMRQPKGFMIQDKEDHVCLLKKSLVVGYVDSDYAGDFNRRRSLRGYIFTFLSFVISWKATVLTIVSLSTTEAEYIPATEAVKETIWLKGLIDDLGLKQESSTVYCGSQSAIRLTKNKMFHEWTKHIDVWFHFIRDVVSHGTVMVDKICTVKKSSRHDDKAYYTDQV
ncbi:hypothetical protein RJ639_034373 [Escallonia herrerae]|uniref:Reverse transcriptase Ty1/copia-type domain-containing protein n=1 Tax=Escallonia herrerae TaxID=1293975 RepID=A0AA88WUG6_9ASTE|nr:hypothetical protein RJ639_034373 [Escallonia herrerae]